MHTELWYLWRTREFDVKRTTEIYYKGSGTDLGAPMESMERLSSKLVIHVIYNLDISSVAGYKLRVDMQVIHVQTTENQIRITEETDLVLMLISFFSPVCTRI
jgi:hypothetical protein